MPKNKEEQFLKLVSIANIYKTLIMAYCLICDDTNAIEYNMQLLEICQELGETDEYKEGILFFNLARIYKKQFNFVMAGKLYARVEYR